MAVTAALSINPASPAPGAVVTASYSVSGAGTGAAQTLAFSGTATFGGTSYSGVTGSFSLPGAAPAESFAVPACPGLTFAVSASNPAVFTATVPASGSVSGAQAVSGSVTVGGSAIPVSATVTLPGGTAPPPVTPPAGAVPYPSALAKGHVLLEDYGPEDLLPWQYQPGTANTPVTNGSGVGENPASPRNVAVTTAGGLTVLQLATTSTADCGIIQSPGTYTTASGVIEALIKFSGFTNSSGHYFGAWSSLWLYGPAWPQQGELDAVETQYGNSYISYHYGTGPDGSEATTDPWTYEQKTVQLQPENQTAVPVAPNIIPDEWTYVTIAFGQSGGNHYCDVYYNGVLYCTVSGPWVTGDPMYVTAGTSFGGPVLGANQTPYDEAAAIEIQYVRVFS